MVYGSLWSLVYEHLWNRTIRNILKRIRWKLYALNYSESFYFNGVSHTCFHTRNDSNRLLEICIDLHVLLTFSTIGLPLPGGTTTTSTANRNHTNHCSATRIGIFRFEGPCFMHYNTQLDLLFLKLQFLGHELRFRTSISIIRCKEYSPRYSSSNYNAGKHETTLFTTQYNESNHIRVMCYCFRIFSRHSFVLNAAVFSPSKFPLAITCCRRSTDRLTRLHIFIMAKMCETWWMNSHLQFTSKTIWIFICVTDTTCEIAVVTAIYIRMQRHACNPHRSINPWQSPGCATFACRDGVHGL